MSTFLFKDVFIEALAYNLPPTEVTSAELEDRLAPLYRRLEIPFGTLEKVSGIRARRLWDESVLPSHAGSVAAKEALERSGIDPARIGALLNCSVSRDYFEPATACLVHHAVGLRENAIAFDITNACIGFANGIQTLGMMIENRVIDAGILVSAETISRILNINIKAIVDNPQISREELLTLLPTFTLGSGAVAFVLCHRSLSKNGHRVVGSVARCASEFNDLCAGDADHCMGEEGQVSAVMRTDSAKLIAAGAKLGGRTWPEASKAFGWSVESIDRIICHQVGRQLGAAFFREMGLPIEKEFAIYRDFGNMVSAAFPTALTMAAEKGAVKSGNKVLCTAFGSGLNAIFTGIEW